MPLSPIARSLIALLVAMLCSRVLGQEKTPGPTPAEIDERLATLDPEAELTPTQAQARELLLGAKGSLTAEAGSRANAAQWREATESAPALAEQLRTELSRPIQDAAPRPAPNGTLADLERELGLAQSELAAARTELDAIVAEQPRRTERQREIAGRLATLATEIEQLRAQAAAAIPPEVDPLVAEAQRLATIAALSAKQAKLAELEAETASYDATRELLPLRRDRASRRVTAAEQRVSAWQDLVNERRRREAKRIADEASEQELARAREIPALEGIAADIAQLKPQFTARDSAPARLAAATGDLAKRTSELREIEELVRDVRTRVSTGRLSSAQGQYLTRALARLGDTQAMEQTLRRYTRMSSEAEWELLELSELEEISSDVERALADLRQELGPNAEPDTIALATALLEQRRALVRQALETYRDYTQTLDELILTYERLIEVTASLRAFIEERVFWVRSVSGVLIPRPGDFVREARWLLDPTIWARAASNATGRVVPGMPQAAGEGPSAVRVLVAPALAFVLLALAYAARWRLRLRSRAPLPAQGRLSQTTMSGTVLKLALAVAAALPMPLALWILRVWLESAAGPLSAPDSMSAPAAVASGLARAAQVLLGINLLRELAQPGAVGAAQFRWAESGLAHLRRHLRWLAPVAVAAAVVVQSFEKRREEIGADAIGRTSFVVMMMLLAAFYFLVFAPRRPLVAEYIKKHRGGFIERAAWAWFPLLVATPIVLAVATILGYAFTALQIQRKLGDTFVFVLLVLVANALVLRWMQLARRKLAIEAARARAAAAEKAEREDREQRQESDRETIRDPEPIPEIDITSVSVQSRKVLQALVTVVLIVGLYGVWSDVLPALRWFERVQVFPKIAYVDPDTGTEVSLLAPLAGEPEADPNAGEDRPIADAGAGETETPAVRVSLADVGLAILLLMLTISASKNVPGLLEITVLPRLPLDAAGRYAVYTVARYLILVVGLVAVSGAMSISWESAQWLAAALTFGLAFGLQEIFANFVSGLIILFEQPVRVGDTVTVGNVSGVVSRIRMRATTIIDWDNKELVIPNKTFITDQVINWTLSDPVTRIIIPVGIAYGADTQRARDLLLRIARESQYVLEKPEPRALFLGFGDNSLNFELRAHIGDINSILTAKSDLHFRIDREFRDAKIEIAFPQRDLHIRSVDDAVLRGLGRTPSGSAPADET
jgi:potassium efflux system protein